MESEIAAAVDISLFEFPHDHRRGDRSGGIENVNDRRKKPGCYRRFCTASARNNAVIPMVRPSVGANWRGRKGNFHSITPTATDSRTA